MSKKYKAYKEPVRNNTTNKNFEYTKGTCALRFGLRTDIKTELTDFLECLKLAVEDVTQEIEKQ